MVRFSTLNNEGRCEYLKHGFSYVPAMLFISPSGKQVEKTEQFFTKEELQSRMENLLKQS